LAVKAEILSGWREVKAKDGAAKALADFRAGSRNTLTLRWTFA